MLVSGGHLLARVIPVPSLEYGHRLHRPCSLIEYRASLSRFVALNVDTVFPGHGRPIAAIDVLATRLRSHSRQRATKIETILRAAPAIPFEIARRLQ